MAKFKVELYNSDNIRSLLQEAYMLADEQLIQAQNEINKLATAMIVVSCPVYYNP